MSNPFVWRATFTQAMFKVVVGRVIKINKTQNNLLQYLFYAEQVVSQLMLISLVWCEIHMQAK